MTIIVSIASSVKRQEKPGEIYVYYMIIMYL